MLILLWPGYPGDAVGHPGHGVLHVLLPPPGGAHGPPRPRQQRRQLPPLLHHVLTVPRNHQEDARDYANLYK